LPVTDFCLDVRASQPARESITATKARGVTGAKPFFLTWDGGKIWLYRAL